MASKSKKNVLTFKEWIIFYLFIGFISSLILIEIGSKACFISKNTYTVSKKKIEIHLVGAIRKPGIYLCEPGVTLGQVIKQNKLLPNADRKQFSSKKILLCSQTIEIPFKK